MRDRKEVSEDGRRGGKELGGAEKEGKLLLGYIM
jgi:general stress protein YciG